ncbi:MAG: sensor histidine kinase [Clostridia bacterium]|nr:sensor histidine kinase [Clostridia bacterium]
MFSNLMFVIEILVAEFLLTFRLKHRKNYLIRFALTVLVLTAAAIFIPTIDNAWYTCLVYLLLFGVSVVALKLMNNEPWINVLFCAIAAYTMQHFAYQFTNLLFTLILWGESPLFGMYHLGFVNVSKFNLETFFWIAVYLFGYFSIYTISWYLFGQYVNKNEDFKVKNQALVVLVGGCLVLNIVLNALIVFSNEPQTVISSIVRHISGAFNCLLLLQWQFELVRSKRLENELDFTKRLLKQAKEQYNFSKENIDLINLKCHDMKHQIREIGSSKRLDAETIKDLENSINVYDSMVKTGNEALDILLTEKGLKCIHYNVILNSIADGKSLSFIKNSDVYSLFGNALDNAIEAVLKIKDEEKRVIGLKVYSVGGLITINVKNFYHGRISLNAEGLPDTTKKDKDYHGYGIKSIRMIVEKYDGNLSIITKDGVFNLNILIPVPKNNRTGII